MRKFLFAIASSISLTVPPVTAFAQSQTSFEELFSDFRASSLSYDDKRFLQTALAFEGHYNGLLDGDWGPRSQAAMDQYGQTEFGSDAEEWHMAVLAFDFLKTVEQDGWAIEYFESLNLSVLFPFKAIIDDPSSDHFVNWRHRGSSLSLSMGIHSNSTAQRLHDFTVDQHNSRTELYDLRRTNFAITSSTQRDGSVLYTRSNFTRGSWSTIMLSANARDIPILNAVAASIDVGYAPNITLTENGKLEQTILQSVALVAEDNRVEEASSNTDPAPHTTKGSGTGFWVSTEGHVLTNAHVVEGCTTLQVDGKPAELLTSSEDFDLALLQAHASEDGNFANFSPTPAKLNSDVTVVGYPLAGLLSGLNVTRGSVSSQLGFRGDATTMQISAPVQPGNSGGPVLAADGEVVGVVVGKLDAQFVAGATGDIPQNVNFAIRGEIAKLFLFQNGIEPTLGATDAPLSPVSLAERASNFTNFVECN